MLRPISQVLRTFELNFQFILSFESKVSVNLTVSFWQNLLNMTAH